MKLQILFLCLFSLFTVSVQAQVIPLNGLKVTITPKYKDAEDEMAVKSAWVKKQSSGIQISWYSLVKDFLENAHYPTYKIKAERGVMELKELSQKTNFFLPSFWGQGYVRLDTTNPLWIDPEYLALKGRQKRRFRLGLVNGDSYLQKIMPDELYEKVQYFQTLYHQYYSASGVRPELPLKKRDRKDLEDFYKGFFFIERIAKTKAEIFVNDVKTSYPAKILGNEYFQMVVLDEPENPLVLQFATMKTKVPAVFKHSFKDFARKFDYQISHISY